MTCRYRKALPGAQPAATRLPIHSAWMHAVQRGAVTASTPNCASKFRKCKRLEQVGINDDEERRRA